MQQEIIVKASNDMIVKGIKELNDILKLQQCKIKPESYLPILIYLNNYANKINDKLTQQSDIKTQSTTVFCINSNIIKAIEQIDELLHNQTKILPEVYLKIIEIMKEYSQILKDQDAGKIIPGPKEIEPERKPEKEAKTETNQNATKKDDTDMSGVIDFFH